MSECKQEKTIILTLMTVDLQCLFLPCWRWHQGSPAPLAPFLSRPPLLHSTFHYLLVLLDFWCLCHLRSRDDPSQCQCQCSPFEKMAARHCALLPGRVAVCCLCQFCPVDHTTQTPPPHDILLHPLPLWPPHRCGCIFGVEDANETNKCTFGKHKILHEQQVIYFVLPFQLFAIVLELL